MYAEAGTVLSLNVSDWNRILESAVLGGSVYSEVFVYSSMAKRLPGGR